MENLGLWEILLGEQPGLIDTFLHYENKGQFGEYATEYALSHKNIAGNLKLFKNLYIPYKGGTTEIDLLMLHEKGIFVFESKNYSGWIFGDQNQLNWTQCLPNGEKKRFYNPIRQNQTHIKALAAALDKPVTDFASYIIFSERCELKKVPPSTDEVVIVRRPNMLKHLRQVLAKRSIVYTSEEMETLSAILASFTNKSEAVKQAHVEEIHRQQNSDRCPFCGNKLVRRSGKYGAFWGCSTYPHCKYTRPIKDERT